jgi:hypothetical protein
LGYALHPAPKCPETGALRNWLVTARRFGWRELATPRALRYPRERLLRSLPRGRASSCAGSTTADLFFIRHSQRRRRDFPV